MKSLMKVAKGVLFMGGSLWAIVAAIMMVLNGSCSSGWGLISMISLLLIGWETLKTWLLYTLRNWVILKQEMAYKEDEETETDD